MTGFWALAGQWGKEFWVGRVLETVTAIVLR